MPAFGGHAALDRQVVAARQHRCQRRNDLLGALVGNDRDRVPRTQAGSVQSSCQGVSSRRSLAIAELVTLGDDGRRFRVSGRGGQE